MKRTLWIINQYASTPATGMGGRSFYLARELAKRGHRVYLIAESNHHLLREYPVMDDTFKFDQVDGFTFVWVKLPLYKEAHSRQRVVNWLLFPWRIQKLSRLIADKPDAVLCSSPSVISFLGAKRLARRFKARLIFEVRDIWPLTLIEIGGYSPKHPFIRVMQWIEDKAYRESDRVVSNLRKSVDHMVSRGMDRHKFAWIPNGFSLDEVVSQSPLNENAKSMLPKGKFIVGYTGTIGVANALDTLIEAAERLRNRSDIAFVVVGEGKEKLTLQKQVKEKSLDNVVFINAIPKIEVQAMLSEFDACFIGWLNDPLYRFGIGANKIPEYLYASKPVLHSYSGVCDPIDEVGAGVTVPAQNSVRLADAILHLANLTEEERVRLGRNGHEAALVHYEYGTLAVKLAKVLFTQ